MIDFDLLGRVVYDPHDAVIDGRLQLDPDARRVAQDLRHLFVERQHQAPFAEAHAFGEELTRHPALADPGNPATTVVRRK